MVDDKYTPPGKLVDETKQPDGTIIQTYEVEILGTKCRYFHLVFPPEPPRCMFTGNLIGQN